MGEMDKRGNMDKIDESSNVHCKLRIKDQNHNKNLANISGFWVMLSL